MDGNIQVNIKEDLTSLTRFLTSFVDGKNSFSRVLIAVLRIYIIIFHIDLITAVVKLQDFTSRFLAIKELNLLWLFLALMNSSPEVASLCDEVDRKLSINDLQLSSKVGIDRGNALIQERNTKLIQSCKFYKKFMLAAFLLSSFLPFLQAVSIFLSYTFSRKSEEKIDVDELPFIMFSYYPENYKRLNVYIAVQFSVCIFLYLFVIHYLMPIFTSISMATTSIIYEIKLLRLRLENCDHLIASSSNRRSGEQSMRDYLAAIVKSHVRLKRDVKALNKGINGLAFGYINVMTLQICMYIFCILEFDDIVTKIKYAFCILFVIIVMSVCTSFGQRITNEGDLLTRDVYNCPWLDMPIWFRKSILIMMIQCCKNLELKPYGLYVLDLRCLTSVVNATYSYFNFFLNV